MRGRAWVGSLVLACSSPAPDPAPSASAVSSGALPASTDAPAARALEEAPPPLLLDSRAPITAAEVDPIVASMEPLPSSCACAASSARAGKLRKMPKRTADTYAECKAALDTPGGDLRACLTLMKLLKSAPRDELLRDNVAARACARGSVPACRSLAESRLGDGVRFDPICAEGIFDKLCHEGDLTSCFRLGTLEREGELAHLDVAAGEALIARACDEGEHMACLDVVMRDKKGDDGAKRKIVERAFAAATKACAADDAEACLELRSAYAHAGQWYHLSTPAKDAAKEREVTQRACGLGLVDACMRLERSERTDPYRDRCDEELTACDPVPDIQDRARLKDWSYRRCAAGWDSSCESLGRYDGNPKPATQAEKQARASWLEHSCLEGAAAACAVLTSPLLSIEPSQSVLQAGCDLGVAASCQKLAKKAGAAGDRRRELELLERACPVVTPRGRDSTSRSACRVAGIMYKDGVGAPQDLGRAAILLQKGCIERRYALDGQACLVLGTMFEDGIGVTKSLSRALDLYAVGCANERYEDDLWSRAEGRARMRGGPTPGPRPPRIEPTACVRLRRWVPEPTREPSIWGGR